MAISEKSTLIGGAQVSRRNEPGPSGYGAISKDSRGYQPKQPPFYLTCRDCVIVSLVVGIALIAIIVSLVFGLPALEEKRREMLNGTLADGVMETTTEMIEKAAEAAGIS